MRYFQITDTNVVVGYPNDDTVDIEQAISNGWKDVTNEYPQPIPYIPTADENKATAVSLLQATDWATIADVGNPQMSNPYLANQAEFIAYRNAVRQYAVYPVAGNIDWYATPQEIWTKV